MKRLSLLLVFLGSIALSTYGQEQTMINMTTEPRSMAMGGVTTTIISSSNTLFNNPSLVSFADAPFQIAASYSATKSADYYSLSTYYQFLSGGAIQAGWRNSSTTDVKQMSFNLAYSRPIARIFSIGLSGRYSRYVVGSEETRNALALDLSSSCRIPFGQSSLLVGAKLNNLGALLFQSESALLPIQLTAGLGFNLVFNDSHSMLFAGDVGYCFNELKGTQVALGVEYEFMQLLQLRGGYHFGEQGTIYPSYASVGAGISFLFFRVEFSYLIASKSTPLHNLYCLNVGLKF